MPPKMKIAKGILRTITIFFDPLAERPHFRTASACFAVSLAAMLSDALSGKPWILDAANDKTGAVERIIPEHTASVGILR